MSRSCFEKNYVLFIKTIFIILISYSFLEAGWKKEREALNNVYVKDRFRVFYTLQGTNALPEHNRGDINRNNVPDYVENIAEQFSVADNLYSHILGFAHPLENDRYRDRVDAIDIHLLTREKSHGSSGDGVNVFRYRYISVPHFNVLSIVVSNRIPVNNLTPAHELFHSYLNGYTMFKNRWVTEGTARWSEYAFKKGVGKQHLLPSSKEEIEQLLDRTYSTQYFWNRLSFLCAIDDHEFPIDLELKDRSYIGINKKIIEDNTLSGYKFMISFFENMNKYDDYAAKDRFLPTYEWEEKEQKSYANNPYILQALKNSINSFECRKDKEVELFLHALDDYLKMYTEISVEPHEIKKLGVAYKEHYKGGERIYARNVWDMQIYDQSLYIGAGNSSNSHPAPNAGPVPIIKYDFKKERFVKEGSVDDEQIDLFRVIDNTLYIPGHDAVENNGYGNLYVKRADKQWRGYHNIPGALHVFDINCFNGKLFAAISTKKGAGVAVSDNKGKSWNATLMGSKQRTYALLTVDNVLYAVKQSLSDKKKKKLTDVQRKNNFIVSEYVNGKFEPRYDLNRQTIFPSQTNKKTIRISKSISFKDASVYLISTGYIKPVALFYAKSFHKNNLDIEKIPMPKGYQPRDMLVRKNNLYILSNKKLSNGVLVSVYKSNIKDPLRLEKIMQFRKSTFARSFEERNGIFYFGFGVDVENSKSWELDDLLPETGEIVRVQIAN